MAKKTTQQVVSKQQPVWDKIINTVRQAPANATPTQLASTIASQVGPMANVLQPPSQQPPTKQPPSGGGNTNAGPYSDIVKFMDKNKLSYFSGSVPDTEKQKMLDESWKEQYAAGKQWINDVNTNLIDRVNSEMDKLNKKALGQVEGTAEQKWKQEGLGGSDTLIGETGTLSLGAPTYTKLGYIPPKREIADNKNIQLTREQEKQPRVYSVGPGGPGGPQKQYTGYSTLGRDHLNNQIVGIATGNSTHNGLANLWSRAFKKDGETFESLAAQAKNALRVNLKSGNLNPLFVDTYKFISRSYDPNAKKWVENQESLTLPQILEKTMVAVSDSKGFTHRVKDIINKENVDKLLKRLADKPIVVDAKGNTYINKYYLQSSQGNRDQLQLIADSAISSLMGEHTTIGIGLHGMSPDMKKNNAELTNKIVQSNLSSSTGLKSGEYHYLITDVLMTSLAEALTETRNGKLTITSTPITK